MIGVVVAAAVLLGLAQTGPGRSALTSAGLVPAPDPFLELYFADPGQHTAKITAPVGQVPVSFVVRSHATAVQRQGWTISVSDGQTTTAAATGSVTLGPGAQEAFAERVEVPCDAVATASRSSVTVSLDGTAQQIVFWLECQPAPTAKPAAR